jgi:hypothetical protein
MVLKENNKLNNEIAQLNAKIGEKEEEIFLKGQQISDITMENK